MSDNCFIFCLREQNEIYLNQKRPSQTHVSKPNVYPFCLRSCSDEWRASVKHAVLKITTSNSQLKTKEKVNKNTLLYTKGFVIDRMP